MVSEVRDSAHSGSGPAASDILAQLDRILTDARFSSGDRSARFLRYVVQQTLAGKSEEIKELVIATELYGRSSDYDPKVDSLVRVEATRLRSRLQSYYGREGVNDPVRIHIPKGAYVPHFEQIVSTQPEPELRQSEPSGQKGTQSGGHNDCGQAGGYEQPRSCATTRACAPFLTDWV